MSAKKVKMLQAKSINKLVDVFRPGLDKYFLGFLFAAECARFSRTCKRIAQLCNDQYPWKQACQKLLDLLEPPKPTFPLQECLQFVPARQFLSECLFNVPKLVKKIELEQETINAPGTSESSWITMEPIIDFTDYINELLPVPVCIECSICWSMVQSKLYGHRLEYYALL